MKLFNYSEFIRLFLSIRLPSLIISDIDSPNFKGPYYSQRYIQVALRPHIVFEGKNIAIPLVINYSLNILIIHLFVCIFVRNEICTPHFIFHQIQ